MNMPDKPVEHQHKSFQESYRYHVFQQIHACKSCSNKKHQLNKEYAKTTKVSQFNLFSGWYGCLEDCEIEEFIKELLS